MLEVLVCNDNKIVSDLYAQLGLIYNDAHLAIRAMSGDDCLGFCLFTIDGSAEIVFAVEPKDDSLMADGLLRSALHVGAERGITEAFYSDTAYEPLYDKINFLENREEKRLKLQNLFSGCCSCAKK